MSQRSVSLNIAWAHICHWPLRWRQRHKKAQKKVFFLPACLSGNRMYLMQQWIKTATKDHLGFFIWYKPCSEVSEIFVTMKSSSALPLIEKLKKEGAQSCLQICLCSPVSRYGGEWKHFCIFQGQNSPFSGCRCLTYRIWYTFLKCQRCRERGSDFRVNQWFWCSWESQNHGSDLAW